MPWLSRLSRSCLVKSSEYNFFPKYDTILLINAFKLKASRKLIHKHN